MKKPPELGAAYTESWEGLIYSFMELKSRNKFMYCGQ